MVQGVTPTEQGLVWHVGEHAMGATRWFRISDATGVVLEFGRYNTR